MEIFKSATESNQEYRDRVLNTLSPSFCGAKWYNATIWLNSGQTTSCHHPPAHLIPLSEVKNSIKAIHNTKFKKAVRQEMLDGKFPKECDYCWKVEALGPDQVSDRIFKSFLYSEDDLKRCITEHKANADVDLQTLEIAFDSNCNFACSYCNSSFSTTWQNDIKTNGKYINLISDGGGAYEQDGSWTIPYGLKNEGNPWVKAFWEWWEGDLQNSLKQLRVTGGEVTMSPDFWKLMDWWKQHPDCDIDFAVNSNLGCNPNLIKRLAEASHSIKNFDLYTSNESYGSHAEYIRDGLIWDKWIENIYYMMNNGNVHMLHIMMTINNLCLFSLIEFMEEIFKMKEILKTGSPFITFNILRFPSFMSIVTLPINIRLSLASKLEKWFEQNKNRYFFQDIEKDGLIRLISYLKNVKIGHDNTSSILSREQDFKSFFEQYDKRRNKNFILTFKDHPDLIEWYESLNKKEVIQ